MRRFVILLCTLVGVASLTGGAALAEGTNTLESSSPAAGETITVPPTQLQLKFTQPAGTAEQVAQMGLALTCGGRLVGLGTPQVASDGLTVSAALTQVPPNGACTVSWKTADESSGSFSFQSQTQATTTTATPLKPGQTTIPGVPATASPAQERRLGGPIGLARLLAFITVSALFGGLLFLRFYWVEGVEYGIAEKYLRLIGIAASLSMVLHISLVTADETGRSVVSAFAPTAWFSILDVNQGRAIFLRTLAVGTLAFFAWIPSRIFIPNYVAPSTAAFVAVALSFGFDRYGGSNALLGTIVAILHMALVMLWVGSIGMVWRVVLYGPGDQDLVHALRGWAKVATPLHIGIIVTGVMQVWRLDGLSLINSGHGRMIIFKTLVVGALLFVGSAVRQFVLQGMRRARSLNQKVVYRLKRPVGVEVAVSIAVLACSSILMSMRPPYVLLRDKGPKTEYAIVQDLTGADDFRVRVSITPGNVGPNRLLIEMYGPKRIQNFVVSLIPANPAFAGYKVFVPITRPGAALLSEETGMKLLSPGDWTIKVEGTTTTGDLEPLTGSFVIADGVTVTTVPNKNVSPTTTTTTIPAAPGTTAPTTAPATTQPPATQPMVTQPVTTEVTIAPETTAPPG